MALQLEVFESSDADKKSQTVIMDVMLLEEAKLASYETGYAAGWEDAAAAQTTDQRLVRAELARNLQTLSFTYHEARDHVLKALQPLLTEIVGKILPQVARDVLAPTVLQVLLPLAEKLAGEPISMVISPAARVAIDAVLEQAPSLPITVIEEPSLSEGQVYLRLADSEHQINLDRATAEISTAVRSFFELPEKERKHG